MVKVYFSHTGNPILKTLNCITCNPGTIINIINQLNAIPQLIGIRAHILSDENKILSHVRLFKNIDIKENEYNEINYYELAETLEIKTISNNILLEDGDNLLISLFQPEYLKELLNKGLTAGDEVLNYRTVNGSKESKNYRPIIDEIVCDIRRENIPEFKNGETTLESLIVKKNDLPKISFNENGFKKNKSNLLPEELVDAIREIWDLPDKKGRLRLFQEDALFFIMAKLLGVEYPNENQLLLSMPTGGGKTEAFMIPIIAHIFKKKQIDVNNKGIKAIIIYPTNALANDQAMRFVELIFNLNREIKKKLLPKTRQITIGILSGDTPRNESNLADESLIQICPKCGNSKFQRENGMLKCKAIVNDRICDTTLDFCRLTKNDIVDNPPDILITNPDEINFALHSPKYAQIFHQKIEAIVFDEVHMYQGIFGCHIAHLLRRIEEVSNHKPLYIGLSATIGNAKQLAALLFNEDIDDVRYIHNKENEYTLSKTSKYRYHLIIRPAVMYKDSNNERYVRTMSVAGSIGMFLGHLIIDSHFRKTIIFANYRNDADDLAKYLKEREELDIRNYFRRIINKLLRRESLDKEEVEICLFIHKWIDVINKYAPINKDVVEIGWNRGGLEKEERIRSIHSFTSNKIIEENINDRNNTIREEKPFDLMVATKTLEVGIDIGDVSTVINSSAPFTTNEYVQRVGRAGRKKDSLAITVVNPENAIDSYFAKYFQKYVNGSDFEDAPIIISNEIIVTRHLLARLLDYFTKKLCEIEDSRNIIAINVANLRKILKIKKNGNLLSLGDGINVSEAKSFAEALYEEMFCKRYIGNVPLIESFMTFLKRESLILDITETTIDEEFVKSILYNKIIEINNYLQKDNEKRWEDSEFVTGFNAKDKALTPSLRGSGATVDLYLKDSNQDTPKDIVTRQIAFNTMPPSKSSTVTASSGISTFEVVGADIESDIDAENNLRIKMAKDEKSIKYFGKKFNSFSNYTDPFEFLSKFNVRIPKKLNVRYFPSRFYCYKCEKGLKRPYDVIENAKGIFCKTCMSKVQQLPLVYLCAHNDGCGKVIDPPIPKVCINPDCPSFIKFFKEYKKNGYKFNYELTRHFKFRLTRDLEWVCKSCNAKMNFSTSSVMKSSNLNKKAMLNVIRDWNDDKKTAHGTAVYIKKNPELFFGADNNTSSYNCSKCRKSTIKTVGVPRVRTVSFNYFGKADKILKPKKQFHCKKGDKEVGSIEFTYGYSIQLAKDFMRRYTSGFREKITTLRYFEIFEEDIFLGNYFDTHIAWFKFSKVINDFVENNHQSCDGNCYECELFDRLDLGKLMKPKIELETYNMDNKTGMPRKPDPRERFCIHALNNKCERMSCNGCDKYDRKKFFRYLIIHTIKHGILWALPKYAGVNVSEIRGEIYPNDRDDGLDLVLVDSNEGGSGAILLIEKHWDEIWNFAVEVIAETCENNANIILPHSCRRFNSDLCPFITRDFLKYIGY